MVSFKKFFPVLTVAFLFLVFSCELMPQGEEIEEIVESVVENYNLEEEEVAAVFHIADLEEGDVISVSEPSATKGATSFKLDQPAYLLMVDYSPRARFAHDVRYVLVSKGGLIGGTGGEIIATVDASWTPLINGEPPDSIYKLYEFNEDVWKWYKPSWLPDVMATPINWDDCCTNISTPITLEIEGAIVVNGNDNRHPDAGISTDANNMYEFYKRFLGDYRTKKLEYPKNTESDLESAIEDLIENKSVNDLTIYIVTHGGRNVLVMGDTSLTAAEFKNMLEKFPEVTFKIVIDACHAGSFIDELSSLDNVAIVLTSTDEDHSAWGDIDGEGDPNPEDEGGEWTSGFLHDLIDYTTDPDVWDYITWIADLHEISDKVALYWYAWDSAWDLDYARMLGKSLPQRSSKVELPPLGMISFTLEDALDKLVETLGLRYKSSLVAYMGEVGPDDLVSSEDYESIPVSTLSYLFFVDYHPGAKFPHPVEYVLVSMSNGSLENFEGERIPSVNGESKLAGENIYASEEFWIWSNLPDWWRFPFGSIDWGVFEPGPLPEGERECAVVVNGNDPERFPDVGMTEDASNMSKFFNDFLDPGMVRVLVPPNNTPDDLENALNFLYYEMECDDITIYISSHGGTDTLIMGRDEMDAKDLSTMIKNYKDADFKVIIDSCYSGSFLDDLKEIDNVIIVLTSTSEDKLAYGDLDDKDPNGDTDEGSEWTSGFIEDLIEYTSSSTIWEQIINTAEELKISEKVVLYWYAWESASETDYARILEWSEPQRWSPYGESIPPLTVEITYQEALSHVVEHHDLESSTSIVFYLGRLDIGTEIEPAVGDGGTTLSFEAYSFMVDKKPGARFAHDIVFSFVNVHTGEIFDHDASWTPLINGESPFGYYAAIYRDPSFWAWSNWSPPSGMTDWSWYTPLEPSTTEVEAAIVVNGLRPTLPDVGMGIDARNMKNFFQGFLGDIWVSTLEYPENTREDLSKAIYDLIEQGADDITIYITTHGNSGFLVLGDEIMTVEQFREMLSYFQEEYGDVKFKVIIDSCRSGSFIDELTELESVVIVLTSSNETTPSFGDIDGEGDPNPDDEGGEWTSGFLHDLMRYTSDPEIWNWILSTAAEYGLSEKVVLYWYAWESAWYLDYARILGLSFPKRNPAYELPPFPFE